MADSSFRITELDNDQILANLTDYFRSQDHWLDYDFAASGLKFLTREQAYALTYAAFYGNMLSAEAFLDSADLRSAIVSEAKSLSYIPKSIKAADAIVNITASPKTVEAMPRTLVIDKGTVFNAGVDGSITQDGITGVYFITTQTYVSQVNPGQDHYFPNVELKQGRYKSFEWVVDSRDVEQRFVLPNNKIDVSVLEVYVQEGTDDARLTRYNLATDIVDVKANDPVFFLEETENSNFRIYFGDGIVGRKVGHGKVVRAVYFETSGEEGNGFDKFGVASSQNSTISLDLLKLNVSVVTVERSSGGDAPEGKESIRFNAPRSFSTRKRAHSNNDWRNVIVDQFRDVRDVKVWGGEDVDSVYGQFGNIFISINPKNGAVLSQRRKDEIINDLKDNYRVTNLTPIIVDPERIYVMLDVKLGLIPTGGLFDEASIKKSARDVIIKYSNTKLESFDSSFEHSKLVELLNKADAVISNSLVKVRIHCRIDPSINKKKCYSFNFKNSILPGSLFSNTFTFENRQVQIDDDGDGNARFYIISAGQKQIVSSFAGTVDYDSGAVNLNAVRIQKSDPNTFDLRVGATPTELNVASDFNKILSIDPDNVVINTSRNGK